jgi:YD repeat-containing protein
MINLQNYSAIATNLFVRLDIPDYGITRFSDSNRVLAIPESDGQYYDYDALGQLMGITATGSDLRSTAGEVTVNLSGIPADNINQVLNYKIKGSSIEIRRAIYDPATNLLLDITDNPVGKFWGIVNNYEIVDEIPQGGQTGTVTIGLICTSTFDVLRIKLSGRRTNPIDQRLYFPTDPSMDRVPNLANSNYNFGAPMNEQSTGTT